MINKRVFEVLFESARVLFDNTDLVAFVIGPTAHHQGATRCYFILFSLAELYFATFTCSLRLSRLTC